MGEGSDRNGLYPMGTALSCAEGSTCPQWAQPVPRAVVSAALQPVIGRPLRGRLLGPVLSVAELRPALARVYVFDVFWLLSFGF